MLNFPRDVYQSHENWGETVYANLEGMEETIESLHSLGDEWEECELGDCTEWGFVRAVGQYGIYQEQHVRGDSFMALVDEGGGYFRATDNRGVIIAQSDDLDEITEELEEKAT